MIQLSEQDRQIIQALADNRMNVSETARKLYYCRTTLIYHLEGIKNKTGLDPTNFWDLAKLNGLRRARA